MSFMIWFWMLSLRFLNGQHRLKWKSHATAVKIVETMSQPNTVSPFFAKRLLVTL